MKHCTDTYILIRHIIVIIVMVALTAGVCFLILPPVLLVVNVHKP